MVAITADEVIAGSEDSFPKFMWERVSGLPSTSWEKLCRYAKDYFGFELGEKLTMRRFAACWLLGDSLGTFIGIAVILFLSWQAQMFVLGIGFIVLQIIGALITIYASHQLVS